MTRMEASCSSVLYTVYFGYNDTTFPWGQIVKALSRECLGKLVFKRMAQKDGNSFLPKTTICGGLPPPYCRGRQK